VIKPLRAFIAGVTSFPEGAAAAGVDFLIFFSNSTAGLFSVSKSFSSRKKSNKKSLVPGTTEYFSKSVTLHFSLKIVSSTTKFPVNERLGLVKM